MSSAVRQEVAGDFLLLAATILVVFGLFVAAQAMRDRDKAWMPVRLFYLMCALTLIGTCGSILGILGALVITGTDGLAWWEFIVCAQAAIWPTAAIALWTRLETKP